MKYTTKELVQNIWFYVKPYKSRFFLGTFLRFSSDVIWLYPAWALSQIINFATTYQPGDSLHRFWVLWGTVCGLAVYHYLSHDGAKYIIYQVSERMRLDVIKQAILHIFRLDPDWHEKENSGNKLQRIHKAGESLDQMMRLYVDLCIESTINVIGITLVLLTLGTWVSGLMIAFFVTYYLISRSLTKKSSDYSLASNLEWEKYEGVLFESINNIATIRSLGFWKPIMSWLERQSSALYASIRKRIFWYRTRSATLNLWREAFRQVIIWYVVFEVLKGNLEVGSIALVLLYFHKITDSASELSEVAYQFELGRISLMRLRETLDTPPTSEISGTEAFPKKWKTLTVKNLEFAYEKNKVLKGVSFTLKRGEKLGIVGLSGAGKSTLFKLLLKLYDRYDGHILFEGEELKDIRRESYLEHFSYVPQETELFNLSLKDNVTLALDQAVDEKRFQKALEIAHVKDFLHKLPQGVESLIGEKGVKLSGGERQRVGIARAVYKHPELLFLDEATSHLDAESEGKIQETLHDFFKEVTAVVIAHRLSTLKEMDRIVVLSKGEVVEEGSFEDLIKKEGTFYRLWKKQSI